MTKPGAALTLHRSVGWDVTERLGMPAATREQDPFQGAYIRPASLNSEFGSRNSIVSPWLCAWLCANLATHCRRGAPLLARLWPLVRERFDKFAPEDGR